MRFVLNSRKSQHVRVITLTTIISLVLGVASLITVLSVMNGFTYVSKNRLTNLIPHISINTSDDYDTITQTSPNKITKEQTEKKIKDIEKIIVNKLGSNKIVNIYPNLQKKAFIINNQQLIPIWINALPSNIIEFKLNELNNGSSYREDNIEYDETNNDALPTQKTKTSTVYNGIVLSSNIIEKLNNSKNISLITADNFYHFYNIDIKDSFTANDQMMGNIAFMDITYASDIFNDYNINNINIDLVNPNNAKKHANKLLTEIPLDISNWTQHTSTYFKVLDYTKQMMFLLLSFIIIVAMFNLISTLTTVLNEKKTDLAILKTLGLKRFPIIRLFLSYGTIITTIGLVLGIILGVLLANNVTYLAGLIEYFLDYKFVNPEIYFINYLPSKIAKSDIFNIVVMVYFIMILSILYPAIRASNVMPAKTLRHE